MFPSDLSVLGAKVYPVMSQDGIEVFGKNDALPALEVQLRVTQLVEDFDSPGEAWVGIRVGKDPWRTYIRWWKVATQEQLESLVYNILNHEVTVLFVEREPRGATSRIKPF